MSEIWVPNQKVQENSSESGEFHHLMDYWPFEEATLRAYWGHYWESDQRVSSVSTTSSILNQYSKIRDSALMASLMNPKNPNFFYKRDMLWQWLLMHEADMHLPFKAKDGREGKPFAEALPEYATLTIDKVGTDDTINRMTDQAKKGVV